MQGQLTKQPLIAHLESSCDHCGRAFAMRLDQNLNYQFLTEEVEPLISVPRVDFGNLADPSIIDVF